MPYFYYEKTATGNWSPVLTDQKPELVSAERCKKNIMGIVEVDETVGFRECRNKWPPLHWEPLPNIYTWAILATDRDEWVLARKEDVVGGVSWWFTIGTIDLICRVGEEFQAELLPVRKSSHD